MFARAMLSMIGPCHRGTRAAGLLPALLLAGLSALPGALAAQVCPDGRPYTVTVGDPDGTQEVTLDGGSKYLGRVVDAGDPLRFQLLSGDVLEIAPGRVLCLRAVAGTRHEGEFWPEDPNTTRLFFGPTGRSLGRGEGYFSVVEILMPFLSIGATDRLTLSGGAPLFFGSEGLELFWLAPKLQVARTEAFAGSVGVLAFFAPGAGGSVGVLYGVGTFGSTSDRAVTVGAGWGYDSEGGIHDAPALMVGFESRMGRSTKFISENYIFPGEGAGILSAGPRFFGEKLTADLGLAMPLVRGADGFFIFPVVNFAWNW
ncbi:MAG TPA: hypothetical protein VMM12_17570 [Longimicrobiales bacterium]|nr:hypothetical protein [Longimicrobiales bacterium]